MLQRVLVYLDAPTRALETDSALALGCHPFLFTTNKMEYLYLYIWNLLRNKVQCISWQICLRRKTHCCESFQQHKPPLNFDRLMKILVPSSGLLILQLLQKLPMPELHQNTFLPVPNRYHPGDPTNAQGLRCALCHHHIQPLNHIKWKKKIYQIKKTPGTSNQNEIA